MNIYEDKYKCMGYKDIIGIDEVGRGPLAGPAVVAGVELNQVIFGLKDSKKLSRKKISELSEKILQKPNKVIIKEVSVKMIEDIGIKKAVVLTMEEIIEEFSPQVALVDFEKVSVDCISESITKGDTKSNSIAAASIVAKKYRDDLMIKLAKDHPGYDFENNVGYGTKKHMDALDKYGIIKNIHRKNFKPIADRLLGDK